MIHGFNPSESITVSRVCIVARSFPGLSNPPAPTKRVRGSCTAISTTTIATRNIKFPELNKFLQASKEEVTAL